MLSDVAFLLWTFKYRIFAFSLITAVVGAAYSYSLPNVYESQSVLLPSGLNDSGDLSKKLGGLASIAGVNLSNSGGDDKLNIALQLLKSRAFLLEFAKNNNLDKLYFAYGGVDSNLNILINDELYDQVNDVWIQETGTKGLSEDKLYNKLRQCIFYDFAKDTGLLTIKVHSPSAYYSMFILEKVIEKVNVTIRNMHVQEAEQAIKYITSEYERSTNTEVKNILISLTEDNMKKIVLAKTRESYVFKTIDPPYEPEREVKPKRLIMVILFFILGIFVSISAVIIKAYLFKIKKDAVH